MMLTVERGGGSCQVLLVVNAKKHGPLSFLDSKRRVRVGILVK